METIPGKILTRVMIGNKNNHKEEIGTLDTLVDLYEKTIIEDTISHYETIQEAAETLGIHASTLSRK